MKELKQRIIAVMQHLQKSKISATVDNIVIHSLLFPGGTLAGHEEIINEVLTLQNSISIGFCQPKFYKPEAWRKAKKIMDQLCAIPESLVKPHDYGRGKGKYSYTGKDGLSEGILNMMNLLINQ